MHTVRYFLLSILFGALWLTPLHNAEALRLVRLPADYHRQEHSLSCEVASLKMALSSVSVQVSEAELINRLQFDPTVKRSGIWGDPYAGFVGRINGTMLGSGYGVYWQPIADLGLYYRRTEVIENASLQTLTHHLDEGRPVVIWGYYGSGNKTSWRTPEGKVIDAINGEHVRTVIGYIGESSLPEGFIVLDPIYGEQYWSWSDLWNNWGGFNHSGVVLYPHPQWVATPDDPTIWEINKDGKTRHGLAMTWERFLAYGGKPYAIVPVGTQDVEQFALGEAIQ